MSVSSTLSKISRQAVDVTMGNSRLGVLEEQSTDNWADQKTRETIEPIQDKSDDEKNDPADPR